MTFEEIQKTIEGMLAVQRQLQDDQLRQSERLERLLTYSERQQAVLDRLIDGVINHEERLRRLEDN
jgi:FixJ family two-component response regulator